MTIQEAFNLVGDLKNYRRLVKLSGFSQLNYIKDCFWGGDSISSESEYNLIVRAINIMMGAYEPKKVTEVEYENMPKESIYVAMDIVEGVQKIFFFSDIDGDWFDTVEGAVEDAQDTMRQKYNGTYYAEDYGSISERQIFSTMQE